MQWLRLALLALSTLVVEVAALDSGESVGRALFIALLWMVGLAFARRALQGRAAFAGATPFSTVFVLLLAAFPFLQAQVMAAGLAPEIALLLAFRNGGLALAALPDGARMQRLSGFIGLCLVTFSVALAREAAVIGAAALYCALGSAHLAASHWNARSWSGTGKAPAPPWGALAAAITLVIGTFGAALLGSNRETTALLGWVPGSGGTGKWSFQSRGGVHDEGDAEVGATKDAFSVGFVDTDVFIESKQNSLYDTFSDTYGNPKIPKERQRKVVVPFQNFIERHSEPAENHDADQQFSTRRTPPRPREANPASRAARALIYVRGRVPLHLKTTAYNRFDGEQWHRELPLQNGHDLEREAEEATTQENYRTNSSWLRFNTLEFAPYFGGSEEHQVKIGTLQTNRVLAPGHLERFRIGRVDRPEFFKWAHDGILGFDAPRFPPATTFVTQTRMSDPRRLHGHHFEAARDVAHHGGDALYFSMPGRVSPLVSQLAQKWTRGVPRGWEQIEAVVAGLREGCQLDSQAVTPAQISDSVGHFLQTKRGPDYQFATSATLMLRSLGYPARLVSGFYARPKNFDARTGHTLIQTEDAHFWPEVLLPRTKNHAFDRAWIALEPTPGYELLAPQQSLTERGLGAIAAAVSWTMRHALPLLILTVLGALSWHRRRRLADVWATFWWHLMPRRAPARQIEATLRLFDGRGRRAKCPRPVGTTPARWLAPLLEAENDAARDGKILMKLADHAAFAPRAAALPRSDEEIRALCRRVAAAWSFSVLERELGGKARASSPPFDRKSQRLEEGASPAIFPGAGLALSSSRALETPS